MNVELEEAEFFQEDFTTASEWELFIAKIAEVIVLWRKETFTSDKGRNGVRQVGVWDIKEEKVRYDEEEYVLSYYNNRESNSETTNDERSVNKLSIVEKHVFSMYDPKYDSNHSIIYEWFGFDEFIVLSPVDGGTVIAENNIKQILSSIQIAVRDVDCLVPFFLQILEKWQRSYLGIYENESIHTNFEVAHLRTTHHHLRNFKELHKVFQDKIIATKSPDLVHGYIQSTYQLSDFGNYSWKKELFDVNNKEAVDTNLLLSLPFGVTDDPIESIILKANSHKCTNFNSDVFDPLQANRWSILVKFADEPFTLLSETISKALNVYNNNSRISDIVDEFISSSDEDDDKPFQKLTEPKIPTISTVFKRATRNSLSKIKRGSAPFSKKVLVSILYFLFPDADVNATYLYDRSNENRDGEKAAVSKDEERVADTLYGLDNHCKGFKTCKLDSLLPRLAIVIGQALFTLGDVRGISYIWHEFVAEMKFRWENSIQIVGVASGYPDSRTCFLHQKLQMLNCCIQHKKLREEREAPKLVKENNSSEEEFYDCLEKPSAEQVKRKVKQSLWNRPAGRLGKFENLKLIETGVPLYIPITQEPVPKTEDQLEEDTDILLRLGSDAQGQELRAKLMSASLLSDMESFKAANPGSILEDFIRWYSPRDWIEEEELDEWGQKKGRLSSRMLIADNTWVDIWRSAKPVPSNRQKRLFDDTCEANKVLHFLDSCTVSQIIEMLFPILSHVAIYRLADECAQVSGILTDSDKTLQRVSKIVEKVSRDVKVSAPHYETLIKEIYSLELAVSQTNSLLCKLNASENTNQDLINSTVHKLVSGYEACIESESKSEIGKRLKEMFLDAEKRANMILSDLDYQDKENSVQKKLNFPEPSTKEYVFKTVCASPSYYSAQCLQFMRAVFSRDEFRIVGAFSEDVRFQ